ncbi:tol-pal system protein YbgF [Cohaesibacter intestini]|uniref:tol-pal system protein YbgF n=1 Tax=Cohaesibacter intestini TaxID=2211145 RepID=UPI000DE95C9B|nr:tol-pal system protein YbgF [Cohaesibacter intestini]
MIRFLFAVLAMVWGSATFAANQEPLDALAKRVEGLEQQARNQGLLLPPQPIPNNDGRIVVAQSAADLAVRVERLENQMRQYTGQMEEMNFRLRQLQEQLRRFQEDSEFRFQDLERGKSPRKSSSNSQPRQPAEQRTQQPQQFEQLGEPPRNLGSLPADPLTSAPLAQNNQPVAGNQLGTQPGTQLGTQPGTGPIDLSSMLGGATTEPSNGAVDQMTALTGDPATDYDAAYGQVLQGNYPAAEVAFRQFVQAYGNDRLAPNAHYWIGESLYQQGDFRGAIQVFLDAYSQYPTAQKAPEILLKTGMSLRKINERDAACATFEELLAKFPNASSGVRQKVRAEIKSAQC